MTYLSKSGSFYKMMTIHILATPQVFSVAVTSFFSKFDLADREDILRNRNYFI